MVYNPGMISVLGNGYLNTNNNNNNIGVSNYYGIQNEMCFYDKF
jgi:hypothetical protein